MVPSRAVAAATVRGYRRARPNRAGTLLAGFERTATGVGARSAGQPFDPGGEPAPSTPTPPRPKAHDQGERLAGAGRT